MSEYKEKLQQIERLKQEAEELRKKELQGAIAKIKEIMVEYEITFNDLSRVIRPGRSIRSAAAPAQFRDPETGKTWSGRGRQPAWFDSSNPDKFRI